MELFILMVAGSVAGLLMAVLLPFLGFALDRAQKRVGALEKHVRVLEESLVSEFSRHKERVDFLSESIDNAGKAFERLHVQLDEVESDLERHKLSSLASVPGKTGPVKVSPRTQDMISSLGGEVKSIKKATKALDKSRASKVQSAVVKNATKQGGKRANKSRNR